MVNIVDSPERRERRKKRDLTRKFIKLKKIASQISEGFIEDIIPEDSFGVSYNKMVSIAVYVEHHLIRLFNNNFYQKAFELAKEYEKSSRGEDTWFLEKAY